MCIDIDTKLQMHGMTNTYNIRSVGSLAAETTVGVLQTLNPNSQVSIKDSIKQPLLTRRNVCQNVDQNIIGCIRYVNHISG
jgi:hypothetical protein